MSSLSRFGVSLETGLLERFDQLVRDKNYQNRSEAIRDLIRDALVREEWEKDEEIVGTITLIYDHHRHDLSEKLTANQHDHHDEIISAMHVHLDHDNCLEVLAVRGSPAKVRHIADRLITMRGVKHGKLVTTTSGRNLK